MTADAVKAADVIAERRRQDAKWGGPHHDDLHEAQDWTAFILEHAEQGHLLEVAALGVAVCEALHRERERGARLIASIRELAYALECRCAPSDLSPTEIQVAQGGGK